MAVLLTVKISLIFAVTFDYKPDVCASENDAIIHCPYYTPWNSLSFES